METWVQSQAGLCGMCNGQIDTVTGFSLKCLLSSAIIIPPVLHIHTSITDIVLAGDSIVN